MSDDASTDEASSGGSAAAADPTGDAAGRRGDAVIPDELRTLIKAAVITRWTEPPPEWMTHRRSELRRLASAMRRIIGTLSATAAPDDAVTAAADELEALAEQFEAMKYGSSYEGFAETAMAHGDGVDRHASFEQSPFIGQANPLSPPLRLELIDDEVHAWGTFGTQYEGPPACVHGGFIAAAFDEVLGATQSMSGNPGMTGRLTIHYRSPTPLHTELHFVGRLDRIEGRKIFTQGQLYAGERLCAEAEGLFISIDFSKFVELRAQREAAEAARTTP
jgi:acyl-coenzyme A thioesterase PaaI-like protein